ncbi:MAG: hypothetical protein AAF355_02625 [Myxococcota bacterium]
MTQAKPDIPSLPKVRDEAEDTPMWVPMLGLALLLLAGVIAVYRSYASHAVEIVVAEELPVETKRTNEIGVERSARVQPAEHQPNQAPSR